MISSKISLLPELETTIRALPTGSIPAERKEALQELTGYIHKKINSGQAVKLNFICTHNSRRSQFAQIWAQTAAACYGIDAFCHSGGVEVTAFNKRAVDAIRRAGFNVEKQGEENPVYLVSYAAGIPPVKAFSKLFDDNENASSGFAAVMTCSHADENCPFIPGAEARIPVRYDDPKAFDDTPEETAKYDERCRQIAAEMFYVFSQISS